MDNSVYDEDYFIFGKSSGKSLYENYRFLPELSVPMVNEIIDHVGIEPDDTVCDFGCARGYIVRVFRAMGYRAFGLDVSQWAIKNADPSVARFLSLIYNDSFEKSLQKYDYVLAKDVLEHIPDEVLPRTIGALLSHANKGIFVVVPLSPADGAPYVVPEYDMDITHCQRRTLGWWVSALTRPGFRVSACMRVPGIKDNYFKESWEEANGFLTVRRENPNTV